MAPCCPTAPARSQALALSATGCRSPSWLPDPRRVLVIGATGVFGERLVAGLLQTTSFEVVAAARNPGRLARLAARSAAPGRLTTVALDIRTVTPASLAATGAFVVVDTAGPYQGGDYRLARAALEAGLHVIDLADARDHVAGFASLDPLARAAGLVALTGASSTPALSNAALDALTAGWSHVDDVAIAIAPGNRAPRGLAVMRSILSYAGKPVRVFADGRWGVQPGWGMLVRQDIPGIGRRWLSLSDTPDLDIVPQRFGTRRSAVFRAGLELPLLHGGLWLASLAVRGDWLPSLLPLARPSRWVATLFQRFGSDRGGMVVEASGADGDGRPVRGVWSLVADSGDGPSIPILPVLAALRVLEGGRGLPPGAHVCAGLLTLPEIEAEFTGRRIASESSLTRPPPSLYQRVLGARFADLPGPLQAMHRPGWELRARGLAQIDGPVTRLARITAFVFRFPPAGENVELSVSIIPEQGRERWVRRFAGRRFESVLSAATAPGQVIERFGPFRFDLALLTDRSGVTGMAVRGWRIGRLSLPRALAPGSAASESVDAEGRFCFDVELSLPCGLGRIVRYRGWLVPQ